MSWTVRPLLIALSVVCTSCATTASPPGVSRLAASERQLVAQTISGASMQVHHCDKVDSVEALDVETNGLDPLMQRLLRPGGSVTERWVTSLCGRKVEHTVFHGTDINGRRALFVGACAGDSGTSRALQVMRLEIAGNALSNWMAAGFAKAAGPAEPVKGLAMLMACQSSS